MSNELNNKEEKKGLFQIFNKLPTKNQSELIKEEQDSTDKETLRSRPKKRVPKKLKKLKGKSISPSTKRKLKTQEQLSPPKKKKKTK